MVDRRGERKWWFLRERESGRLSGREEVNCQRERKWWTVRERRSGGSSGKEEVVDSQGERKW